MTTFASQSAAIFFLFGVATSIAALIAFRVWDAISDYRLGR